MGVGRLAAALAPGSLAGGPGRQAQNLLGSLSRQPQPLQLPSPTSPSAVPTIPTASSISKVLLRSVGGGLRGHLLLPPATAEAGEDGGEEAEAGRRSLAQRPGGGVPAPHTRWRSGSQPPTRPLPRPRNLQESGYCLYFIIITYYSYIQLL